VEHVTAVDVRITNEQAWPVARRVIASFYDRLDDAIQLAPEHRQLVVRALADAFSEGSNFAYSEAMAQLVEAGYGVTVEPVPPRLNGALSPPEHEENS
jgi:hypothetical protein